MNVGLTGGKCFLNVNKDLLNSKASQTLACVAGTVWSILVSMVVRWLTFYIILKEISETIANLYDPSDRKYILGRS